MPLVYDYERTGYEPGFKIYGPFYVVDAHSDIAHTQAVLQKLLREVQEPMYCTLSQV